MPPKKKGKGKGKGKGKKDKGAKAPPPPKAIEDPIDDSTREFYLIQIRDLEGRLVRYQAKCDKLQASNDEMEKQLQQQLEDQESIMTLLKKKIQEQSAQYLELEEAMAALREEKEIELEKLQHEITAVREEAQDRYDQIVAENAVLRGTLESLEEYRKNKKSYDENLQQLQDKIQELQKTYDERLYLLDKQAVLDKDRLRKEMVTKVNLVAAEFRKMSDLQMADTTKRAIQENVTVNLQLQKMSDKTTELVKENERLSIREKDLMRQLEITETTEREMTRKNISNQKVMLMLTDKTKELEAQLTEASWYKEQYREVEEKLNLVECQAQSSSSEAQRKVAESADLSSQLEQVRRDFAVAMNELQRLQMLLKNASQAIRTALQPRCHGIQADSSPVRRGLLTTLLTLMDIDDQQPPPSIISSAYKPGDFGLVPTAARGGIREKPRLPPATRTELPPIQTNYT